MPFPPETISGLHIWLDAQAITGLADGAAVSTWSDRSGFGNDATQGTGTAQPTYKTKGLNGFPSVRFDGSTDWLTILGADALALTNNATGLSVFAVINLTDVVSATSRQIITFSTSTETNARMKLGQRNATNNFWDISGRRLDADVQQNLLGAAFTQVGSQIISGIVDWANSNADVWRNSFNEATTTAWFVDGNTSATNSISVIVGAKHTGAAPAEFWVGDIGEIIVYNRAVTQSEREFIITYLDSRWQLSAPLLPIRRRPSGPLRRFQQYRPKIRSSFEVETVVSAAAPSASGVGQVYQRNYTRAVGAKGSAGTGQVYQRVWTDVDSLKGGTGVGRVEQRAWTDVDSKKGGIGVGQVFQRAWTQATSSKGGVGVGQVVQRAWTQAQSVPSGVGRVFQRAWTQATGSKGAAGSGRVEQRAWTQSFTSKGGIGAGQVIQRAWTQMTSLKGGIGAGRVEQRAWTQAGTGIKKAIGVGQVVQRAWTQNTTIKQITGTTVNVVQRAYVQAQSIPTGVGRVMQRAWTQAIGTKGGVGTGLTVQRSQTTDIGAKGGVGAGFISQRTWTRAGAAVKGGIGIGQVVQRAWTRAGTGIKGATGTGRVEGRNYTFSVTAKNSIGNIARVVQRAWTQSAAFLLQPGTGLRIRIHGRESTRLRSGRESSNIISGRESTRLRSGQEPRDTLSGREGKTTISGNEEGTP
jgi:hypothetical protein